MDDDPPARRSRPLPPLVARRGDRRVILWWNVVAAALFYGIMIGFGSTLVYLLLAHDVNKAMLFASVMPGIMFVVACVVEVLSGLLDILTDLVTGETTSPGRRNVRYPFPLLVARRNGKRVIIWWNVLRMARVLYVFIGCSTWIALAAIRGTSQIGPLLYYGLLAVVIIMSVTIGGLLRTPLDELPTLDDDRQIQ